ncbi:MAG: hypothetical protein GXY83_03565 [Rhodopirellula sp.]|nr:hypothetical protein [Rhodopirellula sp.]
MAGLFFFDPKNSPSSAPSGRTTAVFTVHSFMPVACGCGRSVRMNVVLRPPGMVSFVTRRR